MDASVDVSIVIPAFNEAQRLGPTLVKINDYLSRNKRRAEIIVVDDGSTDNTGHVIAEHLASSGYSYFRNDRNRGKGYSVRRGMLAARGKVILFTDADLSTPIEEFDKLERALESDFDIAIGSRAANGADVQVHQNLLRELMGHTFNRVARCLSFRGVRDSQCGFKAFTLSAAKDVFEDQTIDGFSFDAEIIYLAQQKGYRIAEVGVLWRNSSQSKVRMIHDPFAMLVDLFRIRMIHGRKNKQKT
jgi:dolichyl-phosphate beta-glucosyltransferase